MTGRLLTHVIGLLTFLTVSSLLAEQEYSGTITRDTTWRKAENNHIITGNVTIADSVTLTIEPGVVVKFAGNYELKVQGRLLAEGTEAENIVFTSGQAIPAPGDWKFIFFENADSSIMDYCTLSYGGSNPNTGALYVRFTSALRFANSRITDSGGHGIFVSTGASLTIENSRISGNSGHGMMIASTREVTVRSSVFTSNGGYGIFCGTFNNITAIDQCEITDNNSVALRLSAPSVGLLTNTTIAGNNPDEIEILSGTVTTANWSHGVPYVILGDLDIPNGETLTISPGELLKFTPNSGLDVRGKLIARGRPEQRITFTSSLPVPSPGDWGQLYFEEADSGSVLDFCDFSHGGNQPNRPNRGMLWIWRTPHLLIANSTFTHSSSHGLDVQNGSDLSVINSRFEKNQQNGIHITGSKPDIQTSQVIDNQTGIFIDNATPNLGDPVIGGFNAIFGNSEWQLYQAGSNAIAAAHNFWNSSDSSTIDAGIFDDEENSNSPPVLFTPFLSENPFLNNQPPHLTPISDQTILFGIQTDLPVQATDPDGDALTMQAVNLPPFAQFVDNGGGNALLSLTPPDSTTGTFSDIIITASDGKLKVHEVFNVRVISGNRPPRADAGADQTAGEGELITLDGSGSFDLDNDSLTYQWLQTGGPPVAISTADAPIATFTTPTVTQTMALTFRLDVRDREYVDRDFVTITVENTVNEPPVIQGPKRKAVYVGQKFEMAISVHDPNGEPVLFSSPNLPTGAKIYDPGANTKFFQWQPTDSDTGMHRLIFVAEDGASADTLTVELNVTQPPGPIIEEVTPGFGRVGELVTLRGFAFGHGSGTLLFNGISSPAMISGDTLATALVPPSGQTGTLILLSPNGKISTPRHFTVLPPPRVNLVPKQLEASAPLVLVGNPLRLTVIIKNDGEFDAEARLTFFDDHPDSDGAVIQSTMGFSIGAKETIERSIVWTPQTPGIFKIHSRITGTNPEESELGDNLIDGGVISVVPPAPVESINIYAPEAEFILDKPKNYSIQLLNSGPAIAEIREITVDGEFGFVPATSLPLSLSPGEVRAFDFSVTVPGGPPAGSYLSTIRIKTTSGGEYTQSLKFQAIRENPLITVRVFNEGNGLPLPGVRVFALSEEQPSTNSSGQTEFRLPAGMPSQVVFFKDGFLPKQLEIPAADVSQSFDVLMTPGEIIVSDVEVEPLTSEELEELGVDLNNPENFNYYQFSFTIQFSEDSQPEQITTIIQSPSSEPAPELPDIDQCTIEVVTESIKNPAAEFCTERYRWRRITLCNGDTIHVATHPAFPLYLTEVLPQPCSENDEKEEEIFNPELGCKFKKLTLCQQAAETGQGEISGGVVTINDEISIPYALKVDGKIRTLKEFFNLTLVLVNQADSTFTLTNLQAQFSEDFGQSSALTVVKEAEPLSDLRGGESTRTHWVIRGDQVGVQTIQIDISGTLQPGNISISTIALATVLVTPPPELDLKLYHPGSVMAGNQFTLSAEITNRSDATTAQLASIELHLAGRTNQAKLLSAAMQELGDIAPGETKTAFWRLLALGSGSLKACDESSGNLLGFTLLIDGEPCAEGVPADTTFDTSVPPGRVVLLGTEIGLPHVKVQATGTEQGGDGTIITVQAFTDSLGTYHLPRKIFGPDLSFHLQIPTSGSNQGSVRPPVLDFTASVAQDATAMPGFAYGAKNRHQEMTKIITSLQDTTSSQALWAVIARHYHDELAAVQAFLDDAAENELWNADLAHTREEYFRLFLALHLISRVRVDAESMAYLSSDTIGPALMAIVEMILQVSRIKKIVAEVIQKWAVSSLGGKDAVDQYMQQVWESNLKDFNTILDRLRTALVQLFEIVIARGYPDEQPKIIKDISKIIAGKIIGYYTKTASAILESNKVRTFTAEQFIALYARQTEELIERSLALAESYSGPDSAGSLPYSFSQVSFASARISQGTLEVENTTEGLQLAQDLLHGIKKDLSEASRLLTFAQITPAAPIAVPVKKILSSIKKFTGILEKATRVGAAIPGPLHLFTGIPAGLHDGIEAAFDRQPATDSVIAASGNDRSKNRFRTSGLQTTAGNKRIASVSAALEQYRMELLLLRDYVARDDYVKARNHQAEAVKAAGQNVNRLLSETNAFLVGSAYNAAIKNLPGSDSLYANLSDNLNLFNASRLALPWGFINYSIIAELAGGLTHPDYQETKTELLQIIDDVNSRAEALGALIQTTLAEYDALGLLTATAVIDSIWFMINEEQTTEISQSPARIITHTRVRNLSAIELTDLVVSLDIPEVFGLRFTSEGDTSVTIPRLQPDDGEDGGADEYRVTWALDYDGPLAGQHGLAFRAVFEAKDSTDLALINSPVKVVSFKTPDSDQDGMPDDFESRYNLLVTTHDAAKDPDLDLLTNFQEYLMGTNPIEADSDGDALADGKEISLGFSPLDPQSPVTQGKAALILPGFVDAVPGNELILPLTVNAGAWVQTLQFTIEYDSTQLFFKDILPGADSITFAIESIERLIPDSTVFQDANQAIKVLLKGKTGRAGIFEPIIMQFDVSSTFDSSAFIALSREPEKSFIIDRDALPVTIVAFTNSEIRNQLTVGVDNERSSPMPAAFRLYQNFPNPFNPSTTIRFEIPKTTQVRLRIFNLLGQVVKTLVDQKLEPGTYSVRWLGENEYGIPVSSGVYFIGLKSPDFSQTQKIVLIR